MIHSVRIALLCLAGTAAAAGAQGTLSTQGFGYPPGQLSSQALGSAGAVAEFDPLSPINPASLWAWGRAGLYLQYDPEFRTVEATGSSESSTIARFPLVAAAFAMGSRAVVGVSASTFLDRTWSTTFESGQRIGPDSVTFTQTSSVNGAINDIRLAGSWRFSERFAAGIGLHRLVGENRMSISRVFPDSQKFGALDERFTLSYTGAAVSLGAVWRVTRALAIAASARQGGTLEAARGDDVVGEGTVPARYGVAARLDAIPGAAFAIRAEHVRWSDMDDLGSAGLREHDGWDIGGGAEVSGPRLGSAQSVLRLGARRRVLPFGIDGIGQVNETGFTGGLGLPLAGGRAGLDVALQRASRSASGGAEERSWTLSVGIGVRP